MSLKGFILPVGFSRARNYGAFADRAINLAELIKRFAFSFCSRYKTIGNPISAPPTWAKWAILSLVALLMPRKTSKQPIMQNGPFGFGEKGIGMMNSWVLGTGNQKRNAHDGPEAPTVALAASGAGRIRDRRTGVGPAKVIDIIPHLSQACAQAANQENIRNLLGPKKPFQYRSKHQRPSILNNRWNKPPCMNIWVTSWYEPEYIRFIVVKGKQVVYRLAVIPGRRRPFCTKVTQVH